MLPHRVIPLSKYNTVIILEPANNTTYSEHSLKDPAQESGYHPHFRIKDTKERSAETGRNISCIPSHETRIKVNHKED
jgi:hypothetical protein